MKELSWHPRPTQRQCPPRPHLEPYHAKDMGVKPGIVYNKPTISRWGQCNVKDRRSRSSHRCFLDKISSVHRSSYFIFNNSSAGAVIKSIQPHAETGDAGGRAAVPGRILFLFFTVNAFDLHT